MAGTALSPYLYIWQASEAVEEKHQPENRMKPESQLLKNAWSDVGIGMFFSAVVMYFIILCAAATLHRGGATHPGSASEVARALRPFAGRAAGALFALGIIGVGVLAVPVLTTGVANIIAESARWRRGLNETPRRASKFYLVIAACTVVAMALNYTGVNIMKALLWAGMADGILAAPLMIVIMLITNNRAIMGERVNSKPLNIAGWITTGAIFAAAAGALTSALRP
jgi:Mn2+/Fe2+ NRAMP family transporter